MEVDGEGWCGSRPCKWPWICGGVGVQQDACHDNRLTTFSLPLFINVFCSFYFTIWCEVVALLWRWGNSGIQLESVPARRHLGAWFH